MFGGLPETGGQLDQPAGMLARMRMALNTYNAWSAWKHGGHKDSKKFMDNSPGAWEIVKRVMELERNG